MHEYCDLHTHSIHSDGTYAPSEIILEAEAKHLSHVALCDHNTVSGISEFLKAAASKNVCAIAGTEISTDYNGTELHILALFLDTNSANKLSKVMQYIRNEKSASAHHLTEALNRLGYELSIDELNKRATNGNINRTHIAEALVAKGYAPSVSAAFNNLLSEKCGLYKHPKYPSTLEVIKLISDIGAVSVLAHPLLNLSAEQLCKFLDLAGNNRPDAIETIYSAYSEADTATAAAIAKRYGILPSGGSDFHGARRPTVSLGTGKGQLAVPSEYAWALQALFIDRNANV